MYKESESIELKSSFGELNVNSLLQNNRSIPRNKKILELFHKVGEIENWSTGFARINETCSENDNPAPVFEERAGAFVIKMYSVKSRTTQEIFGLLSENNKLSRRELAKELGNITEDGVKYHLSKLVKQGRLERIGSTKAGY